MSGHCSITLGDVARHLGLSKTTVSLALRNDSRVSPVTRDRIQAAATRLRYHIDPLFAANVAHSQAARPASFRGTLAYIVPGAGSRFVEPQHEFAGARERAEQRGYRLDLFDLNDAGITSRRLESMLKARGIAGVVIAPNYRESRPVALNWSRYSAVVIGPDLPALAFDRVNYNTYADTLLAIAQAWRAGYRRLGLVIKHDLHRRSDGMMLAAYAGASYLFPGLECVPAFFSDDPVRTRPLDGWYRRYRPEAIVSQHWIQVRAALEPLRVSVPDDVAFAGVVQLPGSEGASAVFQQFEALGAAAVDLAIDQLETGVHGLQRHPRTVLIRGVWREGDSLPRRRSAVVDAPLPLWRDVPPGLL